ncbi:hypothetical protein GCM10009066_28420 [Halarchaeum salinum]|uniref:DUF8030 domain-containing protein n=1 Tax=Halarchaeum salinum TaxID=489912 RepID=A0AAV3SAV1_9EURY
MEKPRSNGSDRDHASVGALVELSHEAVSAVLISRQVGWSTRTQYVAGDDVGGAVK